jgi:cyclomaltodextrinase
MNKLALWHNAKSEYSYAFDSKTLYITLRTAKNDVDSVKIIYGDPFSWGGDKSGNPMWKHEVLSMNVRYQSDDFDYYFCEIKPPYLRTKYAFLIEDNKIKRKSTSAKCYFLCFKIIPDKGPIFGLIKYSN